MKIQILFLAALLLAGALDVAAQEGTSTVATVKQLNLMPVPASVELQPGRLAIDGTFRVVMKDYSDARLQAGIARVMKRLGGRTGITFPDGPGADENGAALVIQCQSAGQPVPSLDENESYHLEVS